MKIVITGSSGFIGFHTCIKFLEEGYEVYYEVHGEEMNCFGPS